MAMLSLSPLLALAACFSASYAQDGPNKTAVDPSFDMFGGMSEVIGSHLPFQKYIVSYWDKGWIPHDCAFHAEAFGYAAADLEAFNLTFPDCDEPWVTCRHKDTKTSISTIGYVRPIILHFIPIFHATLFNYLLVSDVNSLLVFSYYAHPINVNSKRLMNS